MGHFTMNFRSRLNLAFFFFGQKYLGINLLTALSPKQKKLKKILMTKEIQQMY